MKNRGWIKLYRDIQQSSIWTKDNPFDERSAWIDMLLMANHEEKEILLRSGRKIVKRGQFHTSITKLAFRWHWSENKVRRFLGTLDECSMAHTERTTSGTTVTIVKYDVFQDGVHTDGRVNERTDGRADERADERADGTRTRTKEELKKNEKRKKEVIRTSFGFEAEE